MKRILIVLFLFINLQLKSQSLDLHLPKLTKKQEIEFKYPLGQSYFKGEVVSWTRFNFKAQFEFKTKSGTTIYVNFVLPRLINNFRLF